MSFYDSFFFFFGIQPSAEFNHQLYVRVRVLRPGISATCREQLCHHLVRASAHLPAAGAELTAWMGTGFDAQVSLVPSSLGPLAQAPPLPLAASLHCFLKV